MENVSQVGTWRKISPGMYGCGLWIPKRTKRLRVFALGVRLFLQVFWIPTLLGGLFIFLNQSQAMDLGATVFGSIVGTVVGMILHELAHAFTCISYKGRVNEIGIMVYRCLPGAYVMMEIDHIDDSLKRAQIFAAGVEANLLLAGISFGLTAIFPGFGGALLGSASSNICMALLNLLVVDGLDGATILEALIESEDFIANCRMVSRSKTMKRDLYKKGLLGTSAIWISSIMTVFQILLPVLIGCNILELVLEVIL